MVSDLLFSELLLFGLLWLYIILHGLWSHDRATGCQTTSTPATPPRKRASDLQPFPGLTHKPSCAACEPSEEPAPQPPRCPPPRMVSARGRHHEVDTSHQFCPHPPCDYGGWVGRGNLRANGHPNGGPWRQWHCVACGGSFLETYGTLVHGKRVPAERIVYVVASLAEGLGIRAVARVFAVDPNTVLQWLVETADHLHAFSQYFLHDVRVTQVQLDELYAVVSAVKAGQVSEGEAIERLSRSPHWVWGAIDPVSKLLLAIDVGERTLAMAQRVVVWPKYPNALLSQRLRLHHDVCLTLNFMARSPILIIHVSRLGTGESGMDWKKLLGSLSESIDEELRLRNAYLAVENRILRQQVSGRVPLSDGDRQALAELGQKLGRKALEEIATVAKPDTILAWYRQYPSSSSDISQLPKSVGRPRIAQEIEDLVVRIARENRSWGYDRIVGALVNLGYTISDQTVGNILKRHGIPPAPEQKKTISWSEFIRIHIDVLGATDFFTSTVWRRMKLVISFLLVFISVGRHTKHFTDMTASLTTWFAFWDADVERWIRSGLKHVMLRLLGYGHVARRPPLSACDIHDYHEGLPRSRGKVILLPIRHLHPIRDGPMRQRPRLGEMLTGEDREAA